MQTTKIVKTAWFLAMLLCCGLGSAQAQTITNADVPDNLNLGTSWVGGTPAGPANIAVWDSTVQVNTTKTLGGNMEWAGIQILNPAGPVIIGTNASGNILTLDASGIDMIAATANLSLSNAIVLGADQTWKVADGLTLTFSGSPGVSTATSLTKTGNGILNFSATVNGTYTGNVSVNGGVLQINSGNGNTSSAVGTGIITNNGATLRFATGRIVGNVLVFNGNCIVDAAGTSTAVDGAWQGAGTVLITNLNASGLTFTAGGNGNGSGNMNNFTGSIIIATNNGVASAGNFRFNNGGGNPNVGNAAMTLDLGNSSVHFTEKNSGAPATFGALYGGPNTQLASAANYSIGGLNLNTTFAGAILSSSSLTKNGTGTFTMTGTNTYTGTTTVNSGVLQVGDGVTTSAGSLGTGAISLAGGALVYSKPDDFAVTNRISGSGGSLVKTNSNIMTYSNNTDIASSATVISQGTLALGVAGFMSSPVSVASGATFDVSQNPAFTLNQTLSGFGAVNGLLTAVGGPINPGGAGVAGTLTFNAGLTESGGVNNQLVLSTPGGTNDLINVIGPLTLTGLNNFTLSCFGGGTIPNGTYPLIAYSGALSGDVTNFTVTAVGVTGTLTNITTTTPPEIVVIISPAARGATNLTWVGDGGANNWDTSSSNWVNGATSFAFRTGDSVLFNDSAFPNTNVDVALTVLPASVTVSNTQQYFLTGVGSINGATGLTKTNSGTLSISATNGYTGSTVVEGGTLEVFNIANSGSGSAIGAAASDPSNLVFYGSTFKYSGSSAATDRGATLNGAGVLVDVASGVNLTVNGTLTGPGALTLVDSGTLTLGAANSYTGGTVISNGILATANQTANASGFGPTTNAITFHGGTLALYHNNGDDGSTGFTFSNPLIVPAGQTGNFMVFERGVVSSTLTGGGIINITANGQRGGFGGDWSAFTGIINVTSNNIVTTNGIGTNFFRIDNALGYSNAVFNLNDNADLDGGGSGGAYSSIVTFDIGELDGTSLATISSPAMTKPTPFPTWRVGWKNTTSTFAGTIGDPAGGQGSITKVGTGTWFLLGQNTYTGPTIVSNGVLALSNNPATGLDGSINYSTNITIAAGAVIDVTGESASPSTWLFGSVSSQILQGNGTIKGKLTAGGGTISPDGGIAGSIGTLTATGDIQLGGTAWMKINRDASPKSDKLVSSSGTISYGGTLVVTNIGDTLQKGDTFTLFSATTLNGSFTLALPYYYTWDTSQLNAHGTITVTGIVTPPSITKIDYSQLANGHITLYGTNSFSTGDYSSVNVLTSTNMALPLSRWTLYEPAYFDPYGILVDPVSYNPGVIITVDPTLPLSFYLLQTQ